ncbi:MAG: phenylalanine--tRNA ligase subunit alpha [Bacteroidia bacterium]
MIQEKINHLRLQAEEFDTATPDALEQFRIHFLGKKGALQELFGALKAASPEEKREMGKPINELKLWLQEKYDSEKARLDEMASGREGESIDLTLDAYPVPLGGRHPLSVVRKRIIRIFDRLGYTVAEGPEIVDDWHNFTALNTPQDHPARDMQDTFYVQTNPDMILRTHTSPVQVGVMENQNPPIRIIAPGRVYRNETVSARAHCQFHQVEGLFVAEDVSFADLKQTLYFFVQELFGIGTEIRLRPSYFPFTEPSAEMDISCLICHGKGCAVCKHTGWVEILGCGMVDPAVLTNCRIDPEKYSGFAFGMGIERIAMLLFGLNDIRLFFENDVRFLKQFQSLS